MAKKKTIELRSAGADVPSGDVNITYNGVRIAGFSEDTDATLKTGMTRVEHDIDIEYTKPTADTPKRISLNITNIDNVNNAIGTVTYNVRNGNVSVINPYDVITDYGDYIFPYDAEVDDYILYVIPCVWIQADSDLYSVTVNGTEISYGEIGRNIYGYAYAFEEQVYDNLPDSINIVIIVKK